MADVNQTVSSEQYEELQRELEKTQKQNQHLQKIISLGTVSTLSTLIEQYLAFSQVQFKKIAHEIQLTDYSRDNVEKVISLIRHLEYAQKKLHVFIDLHEQGIFGLKSEFQKCLFTGEEIIRDLESLGAMLDMSEAESVELNELLVSFKTELEGFIESVGVERP